MTTRMHLLVVDDDPHMCTIIGMLFNKDEYIVDRARDGIEALSMMQAVRYDVIITDIRMPGMGGCELLDHVMAEDRTRKVIMISGNNMNEPALLERGAFGVLRKPFKLDDIRRLVTAALKDGQQVVCA